MSDYGVAGMLSVGGGPATAAQESNVVSVSISAAEDVLEALRRVGASARPTCARTSKSVASSGGFRDWVVAKRSSTS